MRVVFIGTGEIGVPTLSALRSSQHELLAVVTQPDKPAGRQQQLTAPPIKLAVAGSNIPIFQPTKIKDARAVEEIREFVPDVVVVMAYGQILSPAMLRIPRIACLNLHASLLPRWRGAAPIQAAIAAGDSETGISVIYMDEGLDTGDILLQRRIDILSDETGGSLHDRLAQIAPATLLESLRLLESATAPRVPQDNSRATIAPKLKREHGRIDWNEPANVIERKIRAFNPWPGAFARVNERNLKIFAVSVVDQQGKPGEVLASNSEIVVAAGDRGLALGEVQLEGRERMSAAEFVRGVKIERLG